MEETTTAAEEEIVLRSDSSSLSWQEELLKSADGFWQHGREMLTNQADLMKEQLSPETIEMPKDIHERAGQQFAFVTEKAKERVFVPASDMASSLKDQTKMHYANLQHQFPHLLEQLPPQVQPFIEGYDPDHIFHLLAASSAVIVLIPFLLMILYKCIGFNNRKQKKRPQYREMTTVPLIDHAPRRLASTQRLDSMASVCRSVDEFYDTTIGTAAAAARARTGTEDSGAGNRAALLLEQDQQQKQKGADPNKSTIPYSTHTPPQTWADASKQLLPANTKMKSQIRLALDLVEGTLKCGKHATFCSLLDLRLHVKDDLGGVLELFLENEASNNSTNISKKMEHTFESAFEAAQFQQDLLCYQVFGKQVTHMFAALELCHRGSMTHEGKESVLHHSNEGDSTVIPSAVAWDDVLRSLGTTMVGLKERKPFVKVDVDDDGFPSLSEQYQGKRLLLGPVDFFRLFVPRLLPDSIANSEADPSRLESLVELRKQAARASLFVAEYVKSRIVVNHGWDEERQTIKRRIAFDDNIDNRKHDAAAKNEYYEATVSRDVKVEVHSKEHLLKSGSSTPSPIQGYSLVGCHSFQLPEDSDTDHPLAYDKDPIANIPSLRKIVRSNPELDFFCVAFFPESPPRVAFVQLFVRSFPKGVDPAFDTILERFKNGDAAVRNRKLEVFIQLGPGAKLSPIVWTAIKAVSFFLNWTRKGEAVVPSAEKSGAERTPFPGMTMNNYMELHHFGGSLQTDPTLMSTNNYVAATAHVDSSKMRNIVFRTLYQRLEESALQSSIADFTYVLEGTEEDELPERAVGTIRYVYADPTHNALPVEYSEKTNEEITAEPRINVDTSAMETNHRANHHDRTVVTATSTAVSSRRRADTDNMSRDGSYHPSADEGDPNKAGVDALVEILQGVKVPVRRAGLTEYELETATDLGEERSQQNLPNTSDREDLVNVEVLNKLNRTDLLRYYLASDCDLKDAAVRIVESTAWRGTKFPIDIQSCRIELHSGQFFQQGKDKKGNPVFYFRNMCVGPWRKDPDAVINAVLHRFETSLNELAKEKPNVKVTLVVLLGKPLIAEKKPEKKRKKLKKKPEGKKVEDSLDNDGEKMDDDNDDEVEEEEEKKEEKEENKPNFWNPFKMGVNPRLQPGIAYHVHTNQALVKKLVELVSEHYPERLYKAIFVPGTGRGYGYWGTAVGVQIGIRNNIPSPRTRTKCFILHRIVEVKDFIPEDELVTIAGGFNPVREDAFKYK